MNNKDIPDESETKRVQTLIADAVTDHIVDANKMVEPLEEQAAKNQPAVDLLTEWIQRPATEKEREAWEAFEKLVEESEPDETPEEAAERYAGIMSFDVRGHQRGFIEGVRWAKQRPESLEDWKG